jgi:TIR domain
VPRPKRLFLSHAAADRKFLHNLIVVLRKHNISFWYSRHHIRAAQQWHDEIGLALGKCDWFVLLLTPAAVRSKWVKRELLYALQEDRYEKRIVPVVAKPCNHKKLSWTLASFQFIDFTANFAVGCRELLRIWGVRYEPHQSRPPRNRIQ